MASTEYVINEGYGDRVVVKGAVAVSQQDGFFYFRDGMKITQFIIKADVVRHIKRIEAS
ncbi:hypothetical protein [Microbacterium aquimaris]|uniref:Uncharacterized protein n=1 Tax=Microbacterium aquimaris TaxID=459816 RepID=A0ABU5N8F3_9MICO|nr:hypothetical protein [Microbacterium aquimaris]MDZ8162339.1 hypothetical protein [Microbacterium aquimaris]